MITEDSRQLDLLVRAVGSVVRLEARADLGSEALGDGIVGPLGKIVAHGSLLTWLSPIPAVSPARVPRRPSRALSFARRSSCVPTSAPCAWPSPTPAGRRRD